MKISKSDDKEYKANITNLSMLRMRRLVNDLITILIVILRPKSY
jgi:hypothetical protein